MRLLKLIGKRDESGRKNRNFSVDLSIISFYALLFVCCSCEYLIIRISKMMMNVKRQVKVLLFIAVFFVNN